MKIPKIFLILLALSVILCSFVSCSVGFNEGSTTDVSDENQLENENDENENENDEEENDNGESSASESSDNEDSSDDETGSSSTANDSDSADDTYTDETESDSYGSTEDGSASESEAISNAETSSDDDDSDEETSVDNVTTPVSESTSNEEESSAEESSSAIQEETSVEDISDSTEETSSEEETTTAEPEIEMVFSGSSCSVSDTSTVTVSGKIFKIIAPGIYRISGTLSDGQIQVEVEKTEKVTLLLDNFNGSCSDSGVIYVVSADEVYIDLEKNSVNTVTDASTYVFEGTDDKPNACIYSADDLTIKGGGTLTVNANYNNGIGCKNDLVIKNGVVNVTAVKNALKGNDSVTVKGDAVVNILGAKDGIKSDNTTETDKGFVMITETAVVSITCSDDGLQATQNVTVTSGASVTIDCGGSTVNCDGTQNIASGTVTEI